MEIAIIVAMSENNAIGFQNQLLWKLPADLKYFKSLTTGNPIIMGRKTFESIGKALPNRTNIIITQQKDYIAQDCIIVNSIEEALNYVQKSDKAFIIGGEQIYKQTIERVSTLYITKVHHIFEQADSFFPKIDFLKWKLESENHLVADEKNIFNATFQKYILK